MATMMPWDISTSFVTKETVWNLVAGMTPILSENKGRVGIIFSANAVVGEFSLTTRREISTHHGLSFDSRLKRSEMLLFCDVGTLVMKEWFAITDVDITITVFEIILARNPNTGEPFYTGNTEV